MRAPEKQVCWLTDIEDPAEDPEEREAQLNHAARLYRKESLERPANTFDLLLCSIQGFLRPLHLGDNGHSYRGYQQETDGH